MCDAYSFLITKLPEHIVQQYIIPYSMEEKDQNMLLDIRSYTSDLDLVYNYYLIDDHDDGIGKANSLYLLYRHLVSFLNKSVIHVPFNKMFPECEREIRKMWGQMSPKKRTEFVNLFIINDDDTEAISAHNFIQDRFWY